MIKDNKDYGEEYYCTSFGGIPYDRNSYNGHWTKFFQEIAKAVVHNYAPSRVLDVGCAKGFLVEAFRDLGVAAYGFDSSEFAISEVRDDIQAYCKIGTVEDEAMYDGQFDVITCIEVLEHVPMETARRAISLMTQHAPVIIFSSSPTDFDEPTHINVQSSRVWDEEFSSQGHVCLKSDWTREVIAPHAVIYVHRALAIASGLKGQVFDLREEFTQQLGRIKVDMKDISSELQSIRESKQGQQQTALTLGRQVSALRDEFAEKLGTLQVTLEDVGAQFVPIDSFAEEHQGTTLENLRTQNAKLESELSQVSLERQKYQSALMHTQDFLDSIQKGRSFRVLRKMWGLRDTMLPAGTARRALYHRLVGGVPPIPSHHHMGHDLSNYEQKWSQRFETWRNTSEPCAMELQQQREHMYEIEGTPLISVVTPVFRVGAHVLKETIESVQAQSYGKWEMVLVIDDHESVDVKNLIGTKSLEDRRIKYRTIATNTGISEATNAALEIASGEFIALLDHDDLLTPDALYHVVSYIRNDREVDFLYSDKDQITGDGKTRLNPLFKGGWSWVQMMSANFPTHFCVIRRAVIDEVGGFDQSTNGAQDWDMFLKISLITQRIVHIPRSLYHWRIIESSVASGLQAKPYVLKAQHQALQKYLQTRNLKAEIRMAPDSSIRLLWDTRRIVYGVVLVHNESASIEDLIATIAWLKLQDHRPSSLHVVTSSELSRSIGLLLDNRCSWVTHGVIEGAAPVDTLNLLPFDDFSEYTLWIHSGVIVKQSDYVTELLGWAEGANAPLVGGQVTAGDGTLLNCGYVVSDKGNFIDVFAGLAPKAYTTYGSSEWYREYRAVSGLVFLMQTKAMENYFGAQFNRDPSYHDFLVGIQVRVTERGLRAIYTPYARATYPLQFPKTNLTLTGLAEQTTDINFNPNVWDWNKNTVLPLENKSSEVVQSIWDGYTSDALTLAEIYDFNIHDLEANHSSILAGKAFREVHTALWFLPPFGSAFYGGIFTILKFAEYLKREHNIQSTFAIVGTKDVSEIRHSICQALPQLRGSTVVSIPDDKKLSSLDTFDVGFCTLWTTAYSLLKFNRVNRKIYFMQDYEPLFYPAGSTSAQVETTYRFGFQAICNTQSLKASYEEYGGTATYFVPSINRDVFYPPQFEQRNDENKPFKVFLYGRPGNPRNGFELALQALKRLKVKMGDEVQIVSAGAEWDPSPYGMEGVLSHLGMLPYEQTGELYRTCHVGLTMMMTRHPSYLPFELMGCGCVVVSGSNKWNNWMLKDGVNAVVSETSASCIADSIYRVLTQRKYREMLQRNAYQHVQGLKDWDEEFSKLWSSI